MAGTPMSAALAYVRRIAADWCGSHPACFPPVVIHITDGEPTDGDPSRPFETVEHEAEALRSLETNDGALLLFNCHLSKSPVAGVLFPVSEDELAADPYAHLLFRMSSSVPEMLRKAAEIRQLSCPPGARGMAFNADGAQMLALIQTGTPVEAGPTWRTEARGKRCLRSGIPSSGNVTYLGDRHLMTTVVRPWFGRDSEW
jgi:hypothetical protein